MRSACEYLDMAQTSITKISRRDWYTIDTKDILQTKKIEKEKNNSGIGSGGGNKKKKKTNEEFYPPVYPITFHMNMSGLVGSIYICVCLYSVYIYI